MAKKAYIGVDGTARKIKKGYVGVGSLARKVKKAYIGVGGVARPCWSSGELTYYGTVTPLSVARKFLAATTVGNYAIFGGGETNSNANTVDAYNHSLTRNTPTVLSVARAELAATTIGNYALFGGGRGSNTVDAYNSSLTRSTPTVLSVARDVLAATTIGNYALFGGGRDGVSTYSNTVDAYNSSLTRSTPTALSVNKGSLAATTVGDYALFGGGYKSGTSSSSSLSSTDVVDAYNSSLTRSTPTALSVARNALAATTIGDYALFGGGRYGTTYIGSTNVSTVDAYNSSLTRSTPTVLSVARSYFSATTIGDYALFGGGYELWTSSSFTYSNTVDAYNSSLTRSTPTALSVARNALAATTIGNYAIFGGGETNSGVVNTVDAYTIV